MILDVMISKTSARLPGYGCRMSPLSRPVILMLVVLTGQFAFAQKHYKSHVSIGGHAGMTVSKMSFSPSIPQEWADGMTFGVTACYSEERIFGLIAELNFEQRGWRETFDEKPQLQFSRRLSYIELPLMTHISYGTRRFKGFFNAGPEFGLLIDDATTANFDISKPAAAGVPPTHRTEQMTMAVKNKFDYGIAAGLGCEFYIKPRHSINLEARYYFGLGNIFGATKADVFSASRGMSLQIMAGYAFRIK